MKNIAIAAALVLAFFATAAEARPRHRVQAIAPAAACISDNNGRTICGGAAGSATSSAHTGDIFGGATSNPLVSEARRYMGTNPTGRGRAWCGAFMDLVLQKTGHKPGSVRARDYAAYGTRISAPQVGALAVMRHHVGVVSGIDPNGNPIIVSGNHNRTVAEAVYPRGRIMAYVLP